jgi:glutaredoxin-like YruB-family protein
MITVYSTPTCVYCHLTKEYFKSKNIKFEAVDVSVDQHALREMVDKTGQLGVPVIDIDGITIIGFDRPRIDAALQEKKLL